ncbi:MAG: 1-acyl-sn-glycerol-3-phosphate acyltransferase [Candidatus Omnitrophica bacterium]|jgi:1-acyl-sn-glycerol-3-phosphate acyltransferase|nr:1-acyl-sn-glycerol-3-phosphate acyltransferase [Candidatus Omnitrophota bacterium]
MKTLLSIVIWLGSIILTILLFIVVFILNLLLWPFDKLKKATHAQCFWWSDAVSALNPYWNIQVSGLENINPKEVYVVIANHQSLADIVVLYKTRMQFKWVAKASLFNIPFMGWCLTLIKHIKLERGDFASIKRVYHQAALWLRNGMSVLFFPEGTRSQTDQMNEFQNGAFKLAIKEKKPVLPICINGTREAIPRGSWIFKDKAFVKVTVLPAISTEPFSSADFAKLRDLVRVKIDDCLKAG